jgi:nucleoside-diphosphate-sugar epimerase
MKTLIIGCGYVGLPLGALLASQGHTVFGIRRTIDADHELLAKKITPVHIDITDPEQLASIAPSFDIVINLVSSSKGGLDDYRHVYLEGTKSILRWLSKSPPRAYLYTSSTSVYAQADGSWVDESSPAEPDSPTSQVLLDTEYELIAAYRETAFPAIILRASGIYGPERGHLFKQFLKGEATIRDDGASWINMIYVDDLAAAIAHLIDRGQPGEIYNATDDEPVTQLDFFRWLAERLGKPLPPSAPADPNRKRGLTNKRVSNKKLKATGFNFRYPTFREGYTAEMQRLSLKQAN